MYKIIFTLLIGTTLLAQSPNQNKIKAFKVAYITEQLNLSSSEAEKFWPIYNQYESNIETIRQQERQEIFEKLRKMKMQNLSDEEANILIDKTIYLKTQELQHQKVLINELRKAISPQKIIKLKRAEKEFNKKLVERLRNRRRKN